MTIAETGGGLDEAIRRGKEYARIGCDLLFCEFPSTDIEYPRRFARAMREAYVFAGVPAFKELEAKYLPADEVRRKYEGATGL